eukprot:Colp12_sorted_trinity150504_noHs@14389
MSGSHKKYILRPTPMIDQLEPDADKMCGRGVFTLQNASFFHKDHLSLCRALLLSKPLYMTFRVIAAVYTTIWISFSIHDMGNSFWLIFLTHWSYTLLWFHFLLSLCLAIVAEFFIKQAPSQLHRIVINISWVTFYVATTAAITVSLLFWALLYRGQDLSDGISFNVHAMNTVLSIAELLFSGFEHRMAHMFHPMLYGVVYCLFTVVYYAVGATDGLGHRYVYEVTDWGGSPGAAIIIFLVSIFLILPLIFLAGHGIVIGRNKLVRQRVMLVQDETAATAIPLQDVSSSQPVSKANLQSSDETRGLTGKGGESSENARIVMAKLGESSDVGKVVVAKVGESFEGTGSVRTPLGSAKTHGSFKGQGSPIIVQEKEKD